MPVDHREIAFEAAIEEHLLAHGGYTKADPANFDRERAIDPTVLTAFVKETQPEQWEALENLQGADTESVFLDDLCKALDAPQGSLAVIRHGVKCFGKKFQVAYFAPAHGMNPETERALARFMSLHPHNIAQKSEVMVEHFRTFTRHKIGGRAKAMVVTSSRLHAVRSKQAFDKYIAEKGYKGIKTLVAFSGTVEDPDLPGVSYTEPDMNRDRNGKLNAIIDPAVERFRALDEEDQEEFRGLLGAFRNLYSFLSQVIPYQDSDLERLYTYGRFLLAKLPRRPSGPQYDFDDEVALKFYRLQKISEGTIKLTPGEPGEVKGPTEVGTGTAEDTQVELSTLIERINERFGTEFTPADELFFNQIREEAVADEKLREAAQANPIEAFKFVFDDALQGLFIDRMEQNEEILSL